MNKRRKNGLSTHAYLLMRVTLYPLHYLIVPHAYQRRMNVMFLWILLKYLLWIKPVKVLIPLFLSLIEIMCLYIMKSLLYVIVILLSLFEATENYYDRGKYGYRSFHGTKTPLFVLKFFE